MFKLLSIFEPTLAYIKVCLVIFANSTYSEQFGYHFLPKPLSCSCTSKSSIHAYAIGNPEADSRARNALTSGKQETSEICRTPNHKIALAFLNLSYPHY